MELYDKEAISINVGQRLRALREERSISMRELARRSGLSANALSMIERGLTSPSVSTLTKLADAMEVPITAMFRQELEREEIVFVKATERRRLSFNRGLWEGLGGENFSGRLEAFMLTLESGGSSGPHGIIHSGHEFVFCIRGKIEYVVGTNRFVMETGDSLMFTAQHIHRWKNLSSTVANAIIVLTCFEETERPGEFHLSSRNEVEEQTEDQSEDQSEE